MHEIHICAYIISKIVQGLNPWTLDEDMRGEKGRRGEER
jgi:hypothetical protein